MSEKATIFGYQLILDFCQILRQIMGEIQGSVLDIAFKNCDIGPMKQCENKWKRTTTVFQ